MFFGRRWPSPPLTLQIMGLLAGGLVVAQVVTLALTLILPPEPQPQYDLADIARSLAGSPDQPANAKQLEREIRQQAPEMTGPGWLTSERSRRDLAQLLDRSDADVRLYFYTPLPFAGTAQVVQRDDAGSLPKRRVESRSHVIPPGSVHRVDFLIAQARPGGPPGGGMAGPGAARVPAPPPTANPGTLPRGSAQPQRRPESVPERGPAEVPAATRSPADPRAGDPAPRAPSDSAPPSADRSGERPAAFSPPSPPPQSSPPQSDAQPDSTATAPRSQSDSAAAAPRSQPESAAAAPPAATGNPAGAPPANPARAGDPPAGANTAPPANSLPSSDAPRPPAPAGTAAKRRDDGTVGAAPAPAASPQPALPNDRSSASPVQSPLPSQPPPRPDHEEIRSVEQSPAVVPERGNAGSPVPAGAVAEPSDRRPAAPTDSTTASRSPPEPSAGASAMGLFGLKSAPYVQGDFLAAMRLHGGGWVVVRPTPEPFPNAWQRRVLLWFVIAAALVLPAGWLFSRRLVRPLSGFANAAEQLGRDPAAPVLALDGPAEVGRAAQAFNRMQSRLRSFVDDRTAMIGAISHDLRTPLTRMRFRIEDIPDDAREGMLHDVEEMEQMINSVLAFIRDAAEPGPRESLDLASIVQDVVEQAVFVGKQVVLARSEAAPVEVDSIGMRRLVSNLVDNAVKYGDRAEVGLYIDRQDVVVEVSDNGPGLSDEELERVFLPFYRAPAARASNKEGTGLGLAVCRSIARAHGGDVRLARAARGLVARVRLPLAYGAARAVAESRPSAAAAFGQREMALPEAA